MENENTIINDSILEDKIAQWLGVIPYTYQKPMKKMTDIEHNKTIEKLRTLLSQAGIDLSERMILSDYDEKNNSFMCELQDSNQKIKISIRFGDGFDFCDDITMSYVDEGKECSYFKYDNRDKSQSELKLYQVTESLINKKTGNEDAKYTRLISPYRCEYLVENGDYSLSLQIYRPDDANDHSDEQYRLKNEETMKDYISGLSFPTDFVEVYKKICEITETPAKIYKSFKLEIKRGEDITDQLILIGGVLKNFIITKDEKTVTLDPEGNWTYKRGNVSVSGNIKETMDYHLTSVPMGTLNEAPTLSDLLTEATTEVEATRERMNSIQKN